MGDKQPLRPDEQEALDRFQAYQVLSELKRRHPERDSDPACPDCGSREHFECGNREEGKCRVFAKIDAAGVYGLVNSEGQPVDRWLRPNKPK